jgi:SAM-dependent methyltransferase
MDILRFLKRNFTMLRTPFAIEPLEFKDGIPVFSKIDRYVENYQRIAHDHLKAQTETEQNPFIPEELWISLETSTRALIVKHVAPRGRILDVGVGLGRLLGPLTNYERHGIDISLDYLNISRDKGIEVAFARIEDMPYPHGFFDAVAVTDVLEHVLDLNACCRRIIDVLRPGGMLIVRVPFKEDLDVYLREDLDYEFIHLRNFDEASLRLLFVKILNLEYVESTTVAPHLQGTPRFKLRLLPEAVGGRIRELAKAKPHLLGLLPGVAMSAETFEMYLYSLRDQYPEDFNAVVNELVYGIDIIAVFRKPLN